MQDEGRVLLDSKQMIHSRDDTSQQRFVREKFRHCGVLAMSNGTAEANHGCHIRINEGLIRGDTALVDDLVGRSTAGLRFPASP